MTAAAADAQTLLREGVLVAEKYKLVAPIGEGAMGAVWKAEHVTLGHTVAVKFLHGSVANAAEPRARFEREAKLAARLGEASRHITRVMDHGVTPEGTPFLVMEYLQGEGLEVRLKRERRLPIALVAKITTQLTRALHVAHQAGVVHRDLKPANVFLCDSQDDGDLFVKLLDFGVAKATLEGDENQSTRAGALIGTPNYMSPEQITGEGAGVDARSDLWALAAIVYRMAVGRAPFGSGALSELAMRIVSTEPPTPTALAPDLPAEFDLWVQKGLAKKADARFQTARELADSLAMVAGVSATGSTGMFSSAAAERLALQIGDSVGGLQSTLGHSSASQSIAPRANKSRAGVISVAAVAVAAVVGVGIWVTRTKDAPAAAAAPSAAPQPVAQASAAPPAASESAAPAVQAPSAASTAASAAPTPDAPEPPDDKPVPGATVAGKKAWSPPKFVAPKATATTTATATATAEAPPPPPPPKVDIDQKSGDLWKKKDEM